MTRIIAWTGHRPKDLPITYIDFATLMHGREELDSGVSFVTGGALGIDTWATEWALSHGIPYHIILPFKPEVMSRYWPNADYGRLAVHIKHAASLTIISNGEYDVRMYQRRNEAMVDRADEVWTYWTGKQDGGTYNCIRYAERVGKSVFNIATGKFVTLNPDTGRGEFTQDTLPF
jgi:uncharacterized phage-like protein YoqJ